MGVHVVGEPMGICGYMYTYHVHTHVQTGSPLLQLEPFFWLRVCPKFRVQGFGVQLTYCRSLRMARGQCW